MTQNTERLYGVYRTAMLAGNEEFATGSFSAAYAHFNTAMVMSRRLMLLAAAGMTDVDLSVQTLMDATENASSARIRRGDTEGGFRCRLDCCEYLYGWSASHMVDAEFRDATCHALVAMVDSADKLRECLQVPEDDIVDIRSRIASISGAA